MASTGLVYFRLQHSVSDARGRASGARFLPVLAVKVVRTDKDPVPNYPGLRPGQFGTGFRSVRISFTAKIGPKPGNLGPGTGNTITQPKVVIVNIEHWVVSVIQCNL